MVLSWLKGKGEAAGVEELIARKKYGRAVEMLRMEFEAGRRDPRLRLQLADVLVLSGRQKEAVPILLGLGDEFAREGFAAKAISVLKKIEKIQPGRSDVEAKLAALLKEKDGPARFTGAREPNDASQAAALEMGMEEIEPDTAPDDAALGTVLVALIEDVLVKSTQPPQPAATGAPRPSAVSPLFDDFDEAELQEVIHGLQLRSFDPGDVVVVAGEPGESLFVVASGTVKAFVPTREGHKLVREMDEGQFFGEISILTGGERTATITASTRCELLELDRATLDDIAQRRPHVREVMNAFCRQRLADDRRRMET